MPKIPEFQVCLSDQGHLYPIYNGTRPTSEVVVLSVPVEEVTVEDADYLEAYIVQLTMRAFKAGVNWSRNNPDKKVE
mgnify:CR=1 FL=1